MSEPYRYSAGWREILVEDASDGGAFAKITDQRGGGYESITLPADERQAAAEALAGPSYRVVPARDSDDGWIAVQRSEYERLLDRDEYPRVQGTCPSCGVGPLFPGEEGLITCSWVDCKEPDAVTSLLNSHTGQPDRPEPVDPASVKVGDVVDYERKPGYETCRIVGKVEETYETGIGISLLIHGYWWNAAPGMANVRVLHAAEPEPDTAAVEALAEVVHIALATVGPPREDYDWRKWSGRIANLLAGKGYVVSRDE